jgi:hypothetical protein
VGTGVGVGARTCKADNHFQFFGGGGLTVAFLKNPSKWFQKIGTANQNEEKSTKIVTKITP